MRIRTSFVSNSSSSSYIVIDNSGFTELIKLPPETIIDDKFGTIEFGWQQEEYRDFGSKAIFCYLQANYVLDRHPSWMSMLDEVIKEYTGANSITWNIDGYIDHQSASTEGENTEMFEDETTLRNFLFNPASYIQCDVAVHHLL